MDYLVVWLAASCTENTISARTANGPRTASLRHLVEVVSRLVSKPGEYVLIGHFIGRSSLKC
jgi:hypothetical protein